MVIFLLILLIPASYLFYKSTYGVYKHNRLHERWETRIVKMENDEYLVQIWDTEPMNFIHYWQNNSWRFGCKEIRSVSLEIALEEKKKLDELIKNKVNGCKIKEVVGV